jgi:hypothetical protein
VRPNSCTPKYKSVCIAGKSKLFGASVTIQSKYCSES